MNQTTGRRLAAKPFRVLIGEQLLIVLKKKTGEMLLMSIASNASTFSRNIAFKEVEKTVKCIPPVRNEAPAFHSFINHEKLLPELPAAVY